MTRLLHMIKLKGIAPTERFESAEPWNARVTHRVRFGDRSRAMPKCRHGYNKLMLLGKNW